MSQSSIRNLHFREMRGNFSTRINANGNYKLLAENPVMYHGFLAQTQKMYEEIRRLKALPSLSVEEKRLFENHVREYGSRQQLLRNAARYAFEKIFVQVAHGLLPAQWFMAIQDEARQIWRQEGFDSVHLFDMHEVRKQARKSKRHGVFRRLNNVKRSSAIKTHVDDFSI